MFRPVLAATILAAAVAGVAVPASAQGHDSVFGSFFSRVTGSAQAASADASPRAATTRASDVREREARDMRRGYWERERARIAEQSTNRTADATPR